MMAASSGYEIGRRSRCAALLSCLLVSACSDEDPPCYGLEVGQELAVVIVERHDAASQFPGAPDPPGEACPEGFDLAAGDTLRLAVERQTSNEAVTCETSHFSAENGEMFGWTNITSKNAGQAPPAELVGNLSATFEGCEVVIQLRIKPGRPTQDLFAVSEPGKAPYFVLRREFLATEACPLDDCADEFVVTIQNAP